MVTKFGPDRFFGLLKRQYKKSVICTICDIERVVKESTQNNQNGAQLIASMNGRERYVTSYQWTSFLSQFFKTIPSITSYHIFRVSADKPGIVFVKEYSDSAEVSINCLKSPNTSIDSSLLPEVIAPKGLDAKRQWYYRIAGIFRGDKIFVDMENFAGSWKKFRGYVYACTNERGSLHLWQLFSWVNISWFASQPRKPRKFNPPKNTRYMVYEQIRPFCPSNIQADFTQNRSS